jgi:hypothetical protein
VPAWGGPPTDDVVGVEAGASWLAAAAVAPNERNVVGIDAIVTAPAIASVQIPPKLFTRISPPSVLETSNTTEERYITIPRKRVEYLLQFEMPEY